MRRQKLIGAGSLVALVAALLPMEALGYVGPGMGAGVIAATLGVIGAFLLGLFAVIYYPVKRVLRRLRGTNREVPRGDDSATEQDPGVQDHGEAEDDGR